MYITLIPRLDICYILYIMINVAGNIDSESLRFGIGGGGARGGFWWSMHFSWEVVPARDREMQISPAHSYR
jgi:hypothetical protein